MMECVLYEMLQQLEGSPNDDIAPLLAWGVASTYTVPHPLTNPPCPT